MARHLEMRWRERIGGYHACVKLRLLASFTRSHRVAPTAHHHRSGGCLGSRERSTATEDVPARRTEGRQGRYGLAHSARPVPPPLRPVRLMMGTPADKPAWIRPSGNRMALLLAEAEMAQSGKNCQLANGVPPRIDWTGNVPQTKPPAGPAPDVRVRGHRTYRPAPSGPSTSKICQGSGKHAGAFPACHELTEAGIPADRARHVSRWAEPLRRRLPQATPRRNGGRP